MMMGYDERYIVVTQGGSPVVRTNSLVEAGRYREALNGVVIDTFATKEEE